MAVLEALVEGRLVAAPIAVVVAHQDDETIGLGSRLACLADLTLIHVTDGAPLDLGEGREAYAARRWYELEAALAALDARPVRQLGLDFTDQTAAMRLADLTRLLIPLLQGQSAVITHPYEGGHPDHDACAFAIQAACALLGDDAPERLEFACYFVEGGQWSANRFRTDPARPEHVAELSARDRGRKAAALAAFASQARIAEVFAPTQECFRRAPEYDLTAPVPGGQAHYDSYGWAIDSTAWRGHARAALAELGL